jgi:crotonobetainyl-CoA:carnitine CoA-transferase CaiB-like acyl-CoA transferase
VHLPLDDIRVIDLTVARAGPTCVRQLADWGADVIRIDAPARPRATNAMGSRHGADFQGMHRNKRALSLDLKAPEAQEILLRLVDDADVLVENMRPPVKAHLCFDYETVHARNPRLVYGSISGFGQDGPYAERGGVDQIAQGMGGLMSLTGPTDGEPTRAGIPIADLSAGMYMAVGILVALHDRDRTGEGRWVRTSLLEAMIAMLDFQASRWTIEGDLPSREGNNHPSLVPMGCFASSDGYVNIAGPGGRLLRNFCRVIGRPDLPSDPRFDSAAQRFENRAALNEIVGERLRTRTTQEWVTELNEAGVPCGPVYAIEELFADPQVEHLEVLSPVEHPALGAIDLVRNAVTMTGAPSATVRSPSPDVGQHTDEVLAGIGLAPDAIDDLRARGIV